MTNCYDCGDALTERDLVRGFQTCVACSTAEPAPSRPFVFDDALQAVIDSGRPVRVASWKRIHTRFAPDGSGEDDLNF